MTSGATGTASARHVATRFWQDTRIRTLPYDRGFLYFVTVDNALRKASGGRKSLDDLILAILHRRQRDKPLGIADWEAMLRQPRRRRGPPAARHARRRRTAIG
ncbi:MULTISPECIES: hypothetical protein [Xanthomonas translucens group]|uniref:Uncharacterized protein n=1 Tax=Xanthomonas cerealis pv. cerealis TaxID=152263 RepID=A0A514EA48_9XANT|nr:hypothetical protein [Xanthomonas translucens]QDI02673.1 hypothetical protein E4A48_02230 [Xanthomonas translucens pv. cerealis]UKE48057.1 hypothetical protein KHA79_05200 [Xanthomonas translucens pv. cerealis]